MSLLAVQQQFQAAIVVQSALPASFGKRLSIYKNNYLLNLQSVLADIYPVCCCLLGESCFNGLVERFIYQQPSYSDTCDEYGEGLSMFIKKFQPATREVPYLADVAALEWLLHESSIATESAKDRYYPIGLLQDIAESDYDRIIFQLPCTARLYQSCYPVADIWQIHQLSEQKSLAITVGTYCYLIIKEQGETQIKIIHQNDFLFLSEIYRGKTLPMIEAEFLKKGLTLDIITCLPRLVHFGYISGFTLEA